MNLYIKKIIAKDIGPIKDFDGDFFPSFLYVFYGKNETGKTFLVEFIIKTLFSNSFWSSKDEREIRGNGKIIVSGITEDNNDVQFIFNSNKKSLDKLLENKKFSITPSLAKILFVKGGNVEIGENVLSKSLLMELFLKRKIFDEIDSKILGTVKDCEIKKDSLEIDNKGIGKEYNQLKKDIMDNKKIIDELILNYNQGELRILESLIEDLKKQKESLENAKRYKAFEISKKINNLKDELKKIPEEKLKDINNLIRDYINLKTDFENKKEKEKELKKKIENLPWLKSASEVYFRLIERPITKPLFIYISFILFLSSILFSFIKIKILSISLILIFLTAGIFIFSLLKVLEEIPKRKEIYEIKAQFKEKFNIPLRSFSNINEKKQELEKFEYELNLLNIDEIKIKLYKIEKDISNKLKDLTGYDLPKEEWDKKIKELENKRIDLENQLEEKNRELASLNVLENEYLYDSPGISYSKEKFKDIETKLSEMQEEKNKKSEKLLSLKAKIAGYLSEDLTLPWNELVKKLYEKKEEKEKDLREKLADIVAGKLVHTAIDEIKKQQEEYLIGSLNSFNVKNVLQEITNNKYREIKIEKDNIKFATEIDEYDIKDLSTGAKEQVLLAIRIGIIKELLGNNYGFLILDDAFQHVDWERRPLLINSLVNLSKSGWQIFYFTMDDNIKELFEQKEKSNKNIKIISMN